MNSIKRKKWEKRISFILAALILFLLCFKRLPDFVSNPEEVEEQVNYYASTQSSRKVISLVYDDSASMSDGGNVNWAYANYAFQVFAGLLGKNDILYVTYMSTSNRSELLVSPEGNRQGSIDEIQDHYSNRATPMTAVTTAFNRLNDMDVATEATEYWMVVITDGYLQAAGSTTVLSSEYIDEMITDYSNTTLANGSPLNVVYLGIGDDVAVLEDNDENKAIVKYAPTQEDIITSMKDIAYDIESWDEDLGDKVTAESTSANTITITTELPLEHIRILEQLGTANAISVTRLGSKEDTGAPTISENLEIIYPQYPGCSTDENLNGHVVFIEDTDNYLEPGSYEIKFDKAVDMDDLEIMYRVALESRLYIKNTDNNTYVHAGETMNDSNYFEMTLENVLTGTDQSFEEYLETKEGSITNEMQVTEDNEVIVSVKDVLISDRKYADGNAYIETDTELKDGNVKIERSITTVATVSHAINYLTQITGTGSTIVRPNLIERPVSLSMQIYHDDTPYNKTELQNMRLSVSASGANVKVDTKIREDGLITVTPYFGSDNFWYKLFLGWLPSWRVEAKNYQIILTFYDGGEQENFVCSEAFTIEKESFLLNFIYHFEPFFLLWLVWGYFRKSRFTKKLQINYIPLAVHGDLYMGDKDNWVKWNLKTEIFNTLVVPTSLREVLPWLRDKKTNRQIRVEAISQDDNLIRISTLGNYRIESVIIRQDTISRKRDVQIHLNSDRITAVDSTELTTDESVGMIIHNTKTGAYVLYLITFDRKR